LARVGGFVELTGVVAVLRCDVMQAWGVVAYLAFLSGVSAL
jgi:hypothetical protein